MGNHALPGVVPFWVEAQRPDRTFRSRRHHGSRCLVGGLCAGPPCFTDRPDAGAQARMKRAARRAAPAIKPPIDSNDKEEGSGTAVVATKLSNRASAPDCVPFRRNVIAFVSPKMLATEPPPVTEKSVNRA